MKFHKFDITCHIQDKHLRVRIVLLGMGILNLQILQFYQRHIKYILNR
jgi:hypothetical protein